MSHDHWADIAQDRKSSITNHKSLFRVDITNNSPIELLRRGQNLAMPALSTSDHISPPHRSENLVQLSFEDFLLFIELQRTWCLGQRKDEISRLGLSLLARGFASVACHVLLKLLEQICSVCDSAFWTICQCANGLCVLQELFLYGLQNFWLKRVVICLRYLFLQFMQDFVIGTWGGRRFEIELFCLLVSVLDIAGGIVRRGSRRQLAQYYLVTTSESLWHWLVDLRAAHLAIQLGKLHVACACWEVYGQMEHVYAMIPIADAKFCRPFRRFGIGEAQEGKVGLPTRESKGSSELSLAILPRVFLPVKSTSPDGMLASKLSLRISGVFGVSGTALSGLGDPDSMKV
ncbi:hypothetical protein KCU85_g369, partial [Aureobasidium melanogenum]